MTYTLKTFVHNAKEGFIEFGYGYVVLSILVLYWIYSTEWIYTQSVELGSTPMQIIIVTGCYAMLVTTAVLIIYYNTKDSVVDWLKEKAKS